MNKENFIIIEGVSSIEIKKALVQWIEQNQDDFDSSLKFEFYKIKGNQYLIVPDKKIDNLRFNFLINYLYYPEDIKYNIKIEGYTKAIDMELYPKEILKKKLLVYIPEDDTEYDSVHLITEDNNVYKIDFGGTITRVNESKEYKLPIINFEELPRPEKIGLSKEQLEEKKSEQSKKSIEKRFKYITIIISVLAFVNACYLLLVPLNELNDITTASFGVVVVTWFFSDYKMLQSDKYYGYCFIVSIAILVYGISFSQLTQYSITLNKIVCFAPILLLVIQKPMRFLFIRFLKREPVVEKPAPSFWDFVYNIVLFLLPMFLSFYIGGLLFK